jgi:regulatory protein
MQGAMGSSKDTVPGKKGGAPAGARAGTGGRGRRGPRKATPKYLRNSALYYLERYPSSSAHLRRLLLAKVTRSARAHGTDAEEGAAAVEALIAELLDAGLLDDARYAGERARVLHRRGASARAIRAGLLAKGVEVALIDQALAGLREEAAEPELAAALTYARRRRLGPYRSPTARAGLREKDLAALGRQGFGYDLARRIIEADDLAELEDEAGSR